MARLSIVLALVVALIAPLAASARASAPTGPDGIPATMRALPERPAAGLGARALSPGSRIPWQGQDWFLGGANVAWLNWQRDFGGGTKDGISQPDNRALLSTTFANAKASGVNVLRWWTFEGDAWQITRDASGAPAGLDAAIYQDFDTALALAEEHDLYYVFVLFSAPSHLPPAWLNDPAQRQQLADALAPLFARYRDNPRVLSWEVFNEPDHDVWDKKVGEEEMRATVRVVVDAIHAHSNAYATLGMMMLDGLPMAKGLGLDYYQAHWYDYMASGDWCAICTDYATVKARYGLDAPLVIGEVNVNPEIDSPQQRLEDLYQKGYAGAWPWMLFHEKTFDKIAVDLGAMRAFAGRHPDLGPRTTPALAPADPAPAAESRGFSSTALASPATVAPGQRVAVDVLVTATAGLRALVDVEIYGPTGQKVHQQFFDNEAFGPGETRGFATGWVVPADAPGGEYTVKVGVFTPGWGRVYDWNDAASGFVVQR